MEKVYEVIFMDIRVIMRFANQLKRELMALNLFSGELRSNYICTKVCEAVVKWNKTSDITSYEKFLCGLRYSEFYSNGTSSEEYVFAEKKREQALKLLELDKDVVYFKCKEIACLN